MNKQEYFKMKAEKKEKFLKQIDELQAKGFKLVNARKLDEDGIRPQLRKSDLYESPEWAKVKTPAGELVTISHAIAIMEGREDEYKVEHAASDKEIKENAKHQDEVSAKYQAQVDAADKARFAPSLAQAHNDELLAKLGLPSWAGL